MLTIAATAHVLRAEWLLAAGARATHLRNTLGDPSGGRVTGWSTSQGRGGSWFPRPTSSRAARTMSAKYCVSIAALRRRVAVPGRWTIVPAAQCAVSELIGSAQVRSSPKHPVHSAVARHGALSDRIPAPPLLGPGCSRKRPPLPLAPAVWLRGLNRPRAKRMLPLAERARRPAKSARALLELQLPPSSGATSRPLAFGRSPPPSGDGFPRKAVGPPNRKSCAES